MSEIEPKKPAELSDDDLAKIAAHFEDLSDFVANEVPIEMVVTRDLVTRYSVYLDPDGKMEPDQDPLNTEFFRAIVRLEARIVAIEKLISRSK